MVVGLRPPKARPGSALWQIKQAATAAVDWVEASAAVALVHAVRGPGQVNNHAWIHTTPPFSSRRSELQSGTLESCLGLERR